MSELNKFWNQRPSDLEYLGNINPWSRINYCNSLIMHTKHFLSVRQLFLATTQTVRHKVSTLHVVNMPHWFLGIYFKWKSRFYLCDTFYQNMPGIKQSENRWILSTWKSFITFHWSLLIHSQKIPPTKVFWMFYSVIYRCGWAVTCRCFRGCWGCLPAVDLLLLSLTSEEAVPTKLVLRVQVPHWIHFCLPTTSYSSLVV